MSVVGVSLALLLAVGAYQLTWLYDNPVPEGFKDPWELRKIMAQLKIENLKLYLREYTETMRDIYISRRGGGPSIDPQVANISIETEDLIMDGVSVRLYTPLSAVGEKAHPAVVYFHGGGFSLGSVESYDHFCRSFADGSNVKLVSVDYRRSPEHPFPTPLNDCVTAATHVLQNADKYDIDPARIAIAGDSAGGNLAAAAALKIRDLQINPQPKLQVLIVPMLQAINFKSSSFQLFEEDPLLPKRIIVQSWHLYALGHADHLSELLANEHTSPEIKHRLYRAQLSPDIIPRHLPGAQYQRDSDDYGDPALWDQLKEVFMDPYFAPLMSDDVSGLPEAVVMTMGQDVLRDDGWWYAEHLRKAGLSVTHEHYKAGYHAVVTWPVLYQENVYQSRSILYKLVNKKL